jgi:hypothetical protein
VIEIKGLGGAGPMLPEEEINRKRLRDFKTKLGKIAFEQLFGEKRRVHSTTPGISKAEGALKWMEEVLNKE